MNPSLPRCSRTRMGRDRRDTPKSRKQARQADLVSRVVTDVVTDPEAGAAGARQVETRLGKLLARAGIRGRRHRRRPSPRAPATMPTARCASHLDGHNSELKPQQSGGINPSAPDFLSSHPATPRAHSPIALANARQLPGARGHTPQIAPGQGSLSRRITHRLLARIRAEGFVRGRRFLHPSSASPSPPPTASRSTIPARPCSASSTAAARPCASMWCACPRKQTLSEYLTSGWIENIDPATVEEITVNGFPGRDRGCQGRPVGFPPLSRPLRQRRLSLHLPTKRRTAETDRMFRESVGTFRRMSLAEIEQASRCASKWSRSRRATRWTNWRAAWPCGPHGRAFPRAQRARPRRPPETRQRS